MSILKRKGEGTMTHFEDFDHAPGQNPHKYFHNLCIEFRKTLTKTKNPNLLEIEMEKLINASKQMQWKEEKKHFWKKSEGEKTLDKVWTEFSRYVKTLRQDPKNADATDLLRAFSEVERLVEALKVV
jgi:hypothetical protein